MNNENQRRFIHIIRFVTHPAIASLSFAFAVISGVGTIYMLLTSGAQRELMYFVHPGKAAVVRAGQSSLISVQLEGTSVTGDVTAARVAVWNDGETPVRAQNLLGSKHLVIETNPENPIIDAKILKVSREDIVNIKTDTSDIGIGHLKVKWEILEHRDWAILQLIYLGDTQIPITVSATVEQQGEIRALEHGGTIRTPDDQYRENVKGRKFRMLTGSIVFVSVLCQFIFVTRQFKTFMSKNRENSLRTKIGHWILFFLISSVMMTIICFSIYYTFTSLQRISPPFDF